MRCLKSHPLKLAETLLQFQQNDYLCDTVLVADDGRLRAHSNVLAATCPQLKASLKPFYKLKEHVLMVPHTELSVLKIAMHVVYTGELTLPDTLSEPDILSKVNKVLNSFGLQLPSDVHDGISSSTRGSSPCCPDELHDKSGIRTLHVNDRDLSAECPVMLTVDCLEENDDDDSNIFLSSNDDHATAVDVFVDLSELDSGGQWNETLEYDPDIGPRSKTSSVSHLHGILQSKHPLMKRGTESESSCCQCGTSFSRRAGSVRLQRKHHVCTTVVSDQRGDTSAESSKQIKLPMTVFTAKHMDKSEKNCKNIMKESSLSFDQKSVGAQQQCCDSTFSSSSGFQCDVCFQLLRSESTLEQHKLRRHAGAGPRKQFKCAICSLVFSGHNKLKRHAASKHPGHSKFACKVCNRNFAYQSEYKRHMSLHMDDRQFACQVCGKRFPRQASLNSHVRLHSGLKSFQCTICGKLHMHEPSLKRHMMSHTGERPHKCERCPKAFKDRGELRAHSRRIHKVELPIVKPGVRILSSSEMAQHLDVALTVKSESTVELDTNETE